MIGMPLGCVSLRFDRDERAKDRERERGGGSLEFRIGSSRSVPSGHINFRHENCTVSGNSDRCDAELNMRSMRRMITRSHLAGS